MADGALLSVVPVIRSHVLALAALRQPGHRDHPVVLAFELDDADALRVTPDLPDVVHTAAQNLAFGRHQHDFVAVADLEEADREPVPLRRLDADDPFPAASLDAVFRDRRPLAVPAFGHGQDGCGGVGGDGFHPNDFIALFEGNAAHAVGGPAHRPHVILLKPDGNALFRAQQDFPLAVRDLHPDELVAFVERERDDAALARVAEGGELGLFDDALPRRHDDVSVLAEFFDRHRGGDFLVGFQREQVNERFPLGGPASLRDLVDFEPIHLAGVGEEQERVVRGGGEQCLDEVLFLDAHTDLALATAPLGPVEGDRVPLDVAGVGNGDDDFLLGDKVFDADFRVFLDDLRPPLVLVSLPDLDQLVLDDLPHQRLAAQHGAKILDLLEDFTVLLDEFGALQLRQALQAHVEDRVGLDLGERQPLHQTTARLVRRLSPADQRDHRVEVVERDLEPFEDMGAFLRLTQLKGRAAHDDFAAVVDEGGQDLFEVQDLRPVVDQGQHDDPEGRLELGVLVKVVQHDQGDLAALELNDDPDAVAIRFVAQVRDAFGPPVLDELGDFLDQVGLVDLIGNLGDDQPLAIGPLVALDVDLRPQGQQTPARFVSLLDPLRAVDEAGGREIRAGDLLHQLRDRYVRVLQQQEEAVDDFGQVVRGNVRRVADRDAARAVDEQIGHLGGQDDRLDPRFVVVGDKIDGLLVDVGQHFLGELRQPRLGVQHGGGRIA